MSLIVSLRGAGLSLNTQVSIDKLTGKLIAKGSINSTEPQNWETTLCCIGDDQGLTCRKLANSFTPEAQSDVKTIEAIVRAICFLNSSIENGDKSTIWLTIAITHICQSQEPKNKKDLIGKVYKAYLDTYKKLQAIALKIHADLRLLIPHSFFCHCLSKKYIVANSPWNLDLSFEIRMNHTTLFSLQLRDSQHSILCGYHDKQEDSHSVTALHPCFPYGYNGQAFVFPFPLQRQPCNFLEGDGLLLSLMSIKNFCTAWRSLQEGEEGWRTTKMIPYTSNVMFCTACDSFDQWKWKQSSWEARSVLLVQEVRDYRIQKKVAYYIYEVNGDLETINGHMYCKEDYSWNSIAVAADVIVRRYASDFIKAPPKEDFDRYLSNQKLHEELVADYEYKRKIQELAQTAFPEQKEE